MGEKPIYQAMMQLLKIPALPSPSTACVREPPVGFDIADVLLPMDLDCERAAQSACLRLIPA